MTQELRTFAYISTTQNKKLTQLGAYKDEKILEDSINKELTAFKTLPDEEKK